MHACVDIILLLLHICIMDIAHWLSSLSSSQSSLSIIHSFRLLRMNERKKRRHLVPRSPPCVTSKDGGSFLQASQRDTVLAIDIDGSHLERVGRSTTLLVAACDGRTTAKRGKSVHERRGGHGSGRRCQSGSTIVIGGVKHLRSSGLVVDVNAAAALVAAVDGVARRKDHDDYWGGGKSWKEVVESGCGCGC